MERTEEKKSVVQAMLDKLFGEIDKVDAETVTDAEEDAAQAQSASQDAAAEEETEPVREENVEELAREAVQAKQKVQKKYSPTMLGRDVRVEGDIYSEHDMVLDGHIEGNVDCGGTLTLHGRVAGNIYADKLTCLGAKIKGDLTCKGMVTIDEDTVIAGNIEAGALELNGKVDGGIKVRGHASVHAMAYVQGDLDVGGFNADKGSYINGHITIHGDESLRTVHEELSGFSASGRRRWSRSAADRNVQNIGSEPEPGVKL